MIDRRTLTQLVEQSTPYVAYAYAYPHKTAYRSLTPRRLSDVWANERRDRLFLYLHVPFCEMRCGFCNLFTTANPSQHVSDAYVDTLQREAMVVRRELGETVQVSQLAIGGGTPTYLSASQLRQILRTLETVFHVRAGSMPISVETSPGTATRDRLGVLRDFGVDRISMGVQSLVSSEIMSSGRAQKEEWIRRAVSLVRELRFPTLNLDLIYGLPGQTVKSWMFSVEGTLEHEPEELFLYPLYVRPLTGLDRRGAQADDDVRLACYRAGRDRLISAGYEQISMRMFRKRGLGPAAASYCCQEDGMLGLGCGARSYTRTLHYSCEFAVGSTGVRDIIDRYLARSDESIARVDYGCELSEEEQRRRWVIKSLFHASGLDFDRYVQEFGSEPSEDFPVIRQMIEEGYHEVRSGLIVPTIDGLERSDVLAPTLFSDAMLDKSSGFQWR